MREETFYALCLAIVVSALLAALLGVVGCEVHRNETVIEYCAQRNIPPLECNAILRGNRG